MDWLTLLALVGSVAIGLGIEALIAWAIVAIWSLPFWPVFLTVMIVFAVLAIAGVGH